MPILHMRRLSSDRADPEGDRETAFLIRCAVEGDVSAFEQLMIRHERQVLLTALRLLGNLDEAKDAAQEVFLRAYKYLRRFDQSRPFSPWLYRTTANVCRDIVGKRARNTVSLDATIDRMEPVDTGIQGEASLWAEQQRRMMYEALDRLPPKERAALVLRDIQGIPTEEVARILQSSPATVRSQVSGARLKLRKALGKLIRRSQ